jgi:uncharacterized protein (TIGR02145 family)
MKNHHSLFGDLWSLVLVFILISIQALSQVGINNDGTVPDPSAILDVKSTSLGFLPPRMTTAQRNAISSPSAGLVIYNTEEKTLNIFNGSNWSLLTPVICGQPFLDTRNNKIYNTVQIGSQCWMAQNLNVGTMMPGSDSQINNGIIEKYCWGNNEANCDVYGGLYQWDEYMNYATSSNANPSNRQGICFTGWHIPSDAEWQQLVSFLGGSSVAGGKMKEAGTAHWTSPNTGATNSSGFTALPGGNRMPDGSFSGFQYYAFLWSSTEYSSSYSWYQFLYFDYAVVSRMNWDKFQGYSGRCLKD